MAANNAGGYFLTCRDCKKGRCGCGTGYERADWSTQGRPQCQKTTAPQAHPKQANRSQPDPCAANETVNGLDATTEALRHAAEDTPSGADPEDAEAIPVFDRA